MKYFICGFSGAGKSTALSRIKASGTYPGYEFVDLDYYIEGLYPDSEGLGALIRSNGWEWFRQVERETLGRLLETDKIWIALGGGTLDEETAQKLLNREDVKGYWLNTDFEICWERIQKDPNRPMVDKGKQALQELFYQRSGFYRLFEAKDPDVGKW